LPGCFSDGLVHMLFLHIRSGLQPSGASHRYPGQPKVQSDCSGIYGLIVTWVRLERAGGGARYLDQS
jgi:hypothetical protein